MTTQIHLLGVEENIPGIHNKYEALFNLAERFWKGASTIILPGERIGVGKSEHLNLCLAAIYAKQIKLFWSVYSHSYSGLGLEAQLPLRTMYQVWLNLIFLERGDQPEIARQWLLWDYANADKQFKNKVLRTEKGRVLAEELEKSIVVEKVTMGEGGWKDFTKNGPSKLDLASLASRLGVSDGHNVFYPFVSGISHGYDLLLHATRTEPDGITVNITPSESFVDTVLITAMIFLRDCLDIINRLLILGKDSKISELTDLATKARALNPTSLPEPLAEIA